MTIAALIFPKRPRAAALLSLALALLVLMFVAVAARRMEPFHALLKGWFTSPDGVRQSVSSLIALVVAWLLLPLATPQLRLNLRLRHQWRRPSLSAAC